MRLIVPVDLADRQELPQADATLGPVRLTSATVVLPGGANAHGRPPGVVDAMQLLPNAITHRVASRVQAHVDGVASRVASNVGPIPAQVARLGPLVAHETFLLASPMSTDITVRLGRDGDQATLGIVADPARLGPVGRLRDCVAEELGAWGVTAAVR